MSEYLPLALLFVIACGFSITALVMSFILGPHRPSVAKRKNYESGLNVSGPAWVQVNLRYYLIAILFLLFDLELALFYPWALTLLDQTPLGFWAMMLFLFMMLIGFLYEWKKGVLDWD